MNGLLLSQPTSGSNSQVIKFPLATTSKQNRLKVLIFLNTDSHQINSFLIITLIPRAIMRKYTYNITEYRRTKNCLDHSYFHEVTRVQTC